MTTIAFKELPQGEIEFAYDSRLSDGETYHETEYNKVFGNGELVFGVAGYVGFSNLVAHTPMPKVPRKLQGEGLDGWVVKVLVPVLRGLLNEYDPNLQEPDVETLVVVRGRAYHLGLDFGVTRHTSGLYAIGSGCQFAYGAMAAGQNAADAVLIASQFDLGTDNNVQTGVLIPKKRPNRR